MIRLEHITKTINNNNILNDININFRKHELICILGPSGSGKTTLLNLIGRNDQQTSGNIFLGNININTIKEDYYHNSIVSYIYQNYNLIQNLNIKNNIELPSKLTNKKINSKKFTNIINKLSISRLFKQKTKYLSGGEKQRVAIARTILSESKIILADEPTGALDSLNSNKIMKLLKNMSKYKLVIVVTHNEEIAKKYATRIIRIKDGKIISDSNPFHKVYNYNYQPKKIKLKYKEIFKICINNINSKRGRNILKIVAFSISLFFLSLILSINSGLSSEINNLNTNYYYKYPLIISSYASDKYTLSNQTKNKNEININRYTINNNIDDNLLNKIKNLNKKDYLGISYNKEIINNNDIFIANPSNNLFSLLKGNLPQNNNEVLLLLDDNNSVDEKVTKVINIDGNNYNDYLNKVIYLNNQELIIKGIVKSNNEYLSSLNGIVYNQEVINTPIESIMIFPKTKAGKENIKNKLNGYQIIDEAKQVTDIFNQVIKIITLILIMFSVSSFLITIIMLNIMSYIEALERKQEIGILKTLGAKNKDIKKIFLFENYLVGLISSIISLVILYIFSLIINPIIYDKIGLNSIITINQKLLIITLLISYILSKISGYIPAIIASKNKISDVLR